MTVVTDTFDKRIENAIEMNMPDSTLSTYDIREGINDLLFLISTADPEYQITGKIKRVKSTIILQKILLDIFKNKTPLQIKEHFLNKGIKND